MNLFELGETFRLARIAANKTQEQVAGQSGIPRARISRFETGLLPELGTVKLLSLFEAVGLELFARPIGHGRMLDDVLAEQRTPAVSVEETRRRVRLPHSESSAKATRNENGGARLSLSPTDMNAALEQVIGAVQTVLPLVSAYADRYPEFREIGKRMLDAWAQGLEDIKPDAKPRKSVPAPLRDQAGLSDARSEARRKNQNRYVDPDGPFGHKSR
jgi:transcriptional regulator with XRE-family HTH domain